MAVYRVCDRCGKKIGRKSRTLFGDIYVKYGFRGIFNIILGDKSRVDVDLCEDCAKELVEWLHIDDDK